MKLFPGARSTESDSDSQPQPIRMSRILLSVLVGVVVTLSVMKKRTMLKHGMSLRPRGSTMQMKGNTIPRNRTDFDNRARPIPQDMWSRIDNQECFTEEEGAGSDLKPWQRRAPYALIIGAMKSGTSALRTYLQEHTWVVETKQRELHFYDFGFQKYTSSEKGILRRSGRNAYAQLYIRQTAIGQLKGIRNTVALDDSPRYLFWSDRVPARVLCVSPWVKILAMLRNPIDRAFSQYNMFFNKKRADIAFEDWVEQDIEDLIATGVIQDTVPLSEFSGSQQELSAWKAYTRLGTHAPIGRGLYAIQLRHWFKAFEDAGKSRDNFMIIHSELMKEDPDLIYKDALEFLGLPDKPLVDASSKLVGEYHTQLKPETRTMLEKFYAPYNTELYDLLGDDWVGVWDP